MSLAAKLVLAILLVLGGGAAGIRWEKGQQALREQQQREDEAKAYARRLDRQDGAAQGHERDKERMRVQFVTITEEVERVVEKPIYRDVCLDDDGLRILRRAIDGSEAASEPAPALPGPDSAR